MDVKFGFSREIVIFVFLIVVYVEKIIVGIVCVNFFLDIVKKLIKIKFKIILDV